jgi:hypothetical protein
MSTTRVNGSGFDAAAGDELGVGEGAGVGDDPGAVDAAGELEATGAPTLTSGAVGVGVALAPLPHAAEARAIALKTVTANIPRGRRREVALSSMTPLSLAPGAPLITGCHADYRSGDNSSTECCR